MTTPHHPETIDEILEMDKLEYVENTNPLRAEELKDPHRFIKIELLGIIAAYQDPVCSQKIFRDYEEMNGRPLDPSEFGFKSFSSMMRTFSDKFAIHQDGIRFSYTAKKTERSSHLQDLIQNQVSLEEKRRRDLRRSRSYSRSRRSNYGAGIFYAQNFVPLLTDDRTAEQRTADNLASFGRSLAAQDARVGLNWGMKKSVKLESSEESDSDGGGVVLRSKSVPPPRAMHNGARTVILDDPSCLDDDLDDCTNPFNVQNNVRIRDVVIAHGEMDLDSGRKGMAIVEVAARFKKEYRVPLGGVPNLSEERLMKKMSAVETTEWTVEKMGDGFCYVIVLPETLTRAHEVGPGSPSTPNSAEKPKSSGVSPAAKRMFGFALKEAMSVNNRQTGTREKVLAERQESPVYGADSDGDPIALAGSDGNPMMPPSPVPPAPSRPVQTAPPVATRVMDRSAMMALSDHDVLDPSMEARAASMRILRTQTPRGSTGSSPSSISSGRGRCNGPQSRAAHPESSSSMWSSQPSAPAKPSIGFGRGPVPTFGTFKTAPPPVASADKKEDYEPLVSDIIEPSESNLASKLPGMFKDKEESGSSEPIEKTGHRRSESDLRRQMREYLGISSEEEEDNDIIIEEETYSELDDIIFEKDVSTNTQKVYSPPLYPPGLIPMPPPPLVPVGLWVPPPGMVAGCHPLPPPPGMVANCHPFPPPFMPPPGFMFPPGLAPMPVMMPGPPPGLWLSPPPLLHPPGLPAPKKDCPVEYNGEIYYDTPEVWPPPVKSGKAERREKKCLLIEKPPAPTAAPSFPSKLATAAPTPTISFGTSSQSVPSPSSAPRPVPSFGTIVSSSPAQSSFPSAFGGPSKTPTTTPATSPPKRMVEVISSPKKMVEVIGETKNKVNGAEMLGATIQLIGKLRGGAKVFLNEIERTPVEEVVAENHDFFDIDENELIHLLHKDVDPNLLRFDGQTLGEWAKETKKDEAPPVPETRAGAFSRPGPPTFNHLPDPPASAVSAAFSRPSESAPVAAGPRTVPTFAKPTLGPVPSFGTASRPVKVVEDEERPAIATSTRTEASEPAKPRPGIPTFGKAPRKMVEVVEEKKAEPRPEAVPLGARPAEAVSRPSSVMSTASSYSSSRAEPRPGMPSFGTKSLDVRPDSALSNRAEEPKKVVREVPTFARPVERAESVMSARSEKTEDRTQDIHSSSSSTISSSEPSPSIARSLSHSSLETLDVEEKEDADLRLAMERSLQFEKEENLTGPHAFPTHKDIRRLCIKPSLAFDSVRKGQLYLGSVITSFNPNRLIISLVEDDAVANMTKIMGDLRLEYMDYSPALNDSVVVGQFAIAVSGDKKTGLIVRVVVLRKTDSGSFECACLDINALVNVEGCNLYPLMDKFSVHAIRSITFVARINGLPHLTEKGHKAMKLIAKCVDHDDNIMSRQPFVFHGKDVTTGGDLIVDVAALILNDCRWLGEALPEILNDVGKNPEAPMNPDIKHAIQFAIEHGLENYAEVKTKDNNGEDEEDSRTLRSESVEKMQERPIPKVIIPPSKKEEILDSDDEIEKEDGELDSSHDSAASAKTMVDKHAAGDFARDLKEEVVDEFVVAAPAAAKPIIDVESMKALIRRFNAKGENVEVDVIKSMCRALILSVNKTLMTLGDRGALIANAEALEAIEME